MNKRKYIIGLIGLCLSSVMALSMMSSVYAGNVTPIMTTQMVNKATEQMIWKCYKGQMESKKTMKVSDLKSPEHDMFGRNAPNVALITGLGSEWPQSALYNSLSFSDNGHAKVDCGKVFGYGGVENRLLKAYGKTAPGRDAVTEMKAKFLENMGYSITRDKSDCYTLTYSGSKSGKTNAICGSGGGKLTADKDNGSGERLVFTNKCGKKTKAVHLCWIGVKDKQNNVEIPTDLGAIEMENKLEPKKLSNQVEQKCKNSTVCKGLSVKTRVKTTNGDKTIATLGTKYKTAAKNAMKWLSGNKYDLAYKPNTEGRALYQYYMTEYYGADVTCPASSSDGKKIKWMVFENGKGRLENCEYKIVSGTNAASGRTANGLSSNYYLQKDSINSLDDLVAKLGELLEPTPAEMDAFAQDIADTTISKTGNGSDGSESDSEETCLGAGGAKSLGWIVCPILDWMKDTAEDAYYNLLEPNLKIEPQLFTDSRSTLREAWTTFRDIANIIFVVIFLAVILSQITGVGIDNYGIKKILPKLIVVAILINLSYLICLLLVDASNIIGNGAQSLFANMASGLGKLQLGVDGVTTYGGDTNGVVPNETGSLVSVGILTALGGATGIIMGSPMIIVSLLVSALGVVISIFFLFILLAARQAAVVVLVVISPIAVVLYALPNTKGTFDKWRKLFTGLLLVYPIAGLLVAGGNYVSALLLTAGMGDEFMTALVAMIVGIVPIFFIPTVLRSSFAALGNIGARISGIGQAVGRRTTSGVRNSRAYKGLEQMQGEWQTRRRAGVDRDGNLTARGERMAQAKPGSFRQRRQARALREAKKVQNESKEANAMLVNAMSERGIAEVDGNPVKYYKGKLEEAAKSGNTMQMSSIIDAAVSSGYMKDKDIASMVRNIVGDANFKDGATRAAWMRNTASKYGGGFLGTDLELKTWLAKGGMEGENAIKLDKEYGKYAADYIGVDDIKPEDLLKLSGDSLAGMLTSGKVDNNMAQRALVSGKNLSPDKKIMLAAKANNVLPAEIDAEALKNEAKSLATSAAANGNVEANDVVGTIGGVNVTRAQYEAWTSVTPESVRVVNSEPVDIDIQHGNS